MERQLELKQEDNRENRRIIAGLVQRVSELESAPERREARETASEGNGREGSTPRSGTASWLVEALLRLRIAGGQLRERRGRRFSKAG